MIIRISQFSSFTNTLTFLSLLSLAACNNGDDKGQEKTVQTDSLSRNIEITAANIAGNFSTQSSIKVENTILDSFFIRYPLVASYEKNLRSFYNSRNFALAWYDSAGLIEQAGNLYNRMQNLEAEGLPGTIPYLETVDSLMSGGDMSDTRQTTTTDLLLTGMYFYFADKVWGGMSDANLQKIDWFLPRKKIDYEARLDTLLKTPGSFAGSGEPVYRQYGLLTTALAKYKDIAAKNQCPPIVFDKKSYRAGDSSKTISLLKKMLYMLGDLSTPSETTLFDSAMVEGVKNFQHRFGMKEDGVIGQEMMRELNTPIKKRIEQIIVNIERSRWLPDQAAESDYIAVNIPEFKLYVNHADSVLWKMNVVVGKAANKTVIFSGNLKYVVFSPYWNVPTSILNKEVLPGIRKNKNYLASHHMEWNGKSVRQKPGPWNSLGQVKFLFPNNYSIYFHDTPSKSLFAEDKRAFSHGCIRLAEPKKMAQYLLRNDPAWSDQKITDAMNSGKEQYVTLKEPVPVFIAYFTAWVDKQGRLNFRNDIYDRDSRLSKMLGN